jgi:hypothetical protein
MFFGMRFSTTAKDHPDLERQYHTWLSEHPKAEITNENQIAESFTIALQMEGHPKPKDWTVPLTIFYRENDL